MSFYIPVFLIILGLLAVFFRADFILILTYLLLGVFFIGRWWGVRALRLVVGKRHFTDHVFFGEKIPIALEIKNSSWLPVVWLQLYESLPVELITNQVGLQEVISLNPKGSIRYQYLLEARKRGMYRIGPLFLSSGDIFGLGRSESYQIKPDFLVVYPKIIPFAQVKLPSRSPMGTLRHYQPIYEDPTRVRGKRDYVSGDSLRQVDWKATATSGRLQVKIFEPSIALETEIFLNLNALDFEHHSRIDASELAIVVAASLATWVIKKKQSVGLITNGIEPINIEKNGLNPDQKTLQYPTMIFPRRGQSHLMRILETLAKVQVAETFPITNLIQEQIVNLAWGTTIILISPVFNEVFFEHLFQARRSGLNPVLVPCGPVVGVDEVRRKANYFGIPFYQIFNEQDLDMWRT